MGVLGRRGKGLVILEDYYWGYKVVIWGFWLWIIEIKFEWFKLKRNLKKNIKKFIKLVGREEGRC